MADLSAKIENARKEVADLKQKIKSNRKASTFSFSSLVGIPAPWLACLPK